MENLITLTDYILFIVFTFLGAVLVKKIIFRNLEPVFQKLMLTLFFCKVFAVLVYALLVVYYWKLADSVSVYSESLNLVKLIKADVGNLTLIFTPVENYNSVIKLDNSLTTIPGGAGLESNYFLTRICTLLYPFSFGRYLIINFWFAFISAIAHFKLYTTLTKIYPKVNPAHLFYIFLLPMLLFYTSPIYKETLGLTFLCFIIVCAYNIYKKINITRNFISLAVLFLFLYLIKSYVFYAIIVSAALAYLFKLLSVLFSKGILVKFFALIIVALIIAIVFKSAPLLEPYLLTMVDISNFNQHIYNLEPGEGSSFEFGEIETSVKGLVSKIPFGLYTCYFRPHLWEINKPILLASALESFLSFLLILYCLVFNRKAIATVYKSDFFTRLIVIYIIALGIIIGLTTFNFGTLVRYKAMSTIFLWLFIVLLINSKKKLQKEL
jgi:hypothetical protein